MDREILIFPVQLTTSRIGNLTGLIHTLAIRVTIPYMKIGSDSIERGDMSRRRILFAGFVARMEDTIQGK